MFTINPDTAAARLAFVQDNVNPFLQLLVSSSFSGFRVRPSRDYAVVLLRSVNGEYQIYLNATTSQALEFLDDSGTLVAVEFYAKYICVDQAP